MTAMGRKRSFRIVELTQIWPQGISIESAAAVTGVGERTLGGEPDFVRWAITGIVAGAN